MFKNHTMQVKVVKTPPGDEPVTEQIEITNATDIVASVGIAIEDIIKESVKMVAAYVAMDTARKVIVALVTK